MRLLAQGQAVQGQLEVVPGVQAQELALLARTRWARRLPGRVQRVGPQGTQAAWLVVQQRGLSWAARERAQGRVLQLAQERQEAREQEQG